MEFLETNSKNFEALADNVVTRAAQGDGTADLLENLAKVAKEASLKPKEVERLVEGVNMQVTLDHLKTASDKRTSIPLINKEAALEKTHGSSMRKAASRAANETLRFSDDDRISEFNPDGSLFSIFGVEKVAAQQVPANDQAILFKLDHEVQSAQLAREAALSKIASSYDHLLAQFSQYEGPDFHTFRAKLAALHTRGELLGDALANDLRIGDSIEVKLASVIDDTDPEITKAIELLDDMAKHAELTVQVESAKQKLTNYREEIWREFKEAY